MIPVKEKIEPGAYEHESLGRVVVEAVFGRGAHRQVRLKEPLPGWKWRYARIGWFRKHFTKAAN